MQPNLDDSDFMKGMEDLLDIDADHVEEIIEKLDADALAALNDAIANKDQQAAERIISDVHTDEKVNKLFRGNLEDEEEEQPKKHARKVDKNYGFKYGDDVLVLVKDVDEKTGKVTVKRKDGTVFIPNGPGNTVGVKIKGIPTMVNHGNVRSLEENVLGMVNLPNLDRMQQLAGIQPAGLQPTVEQPQEIAVPGADEQSAEADPCQSAQQAIAALDAVQALLPNIRLSDLKVIRQKISGLQAVMNEGAVPERARKH